MLFGSTMTPLEYGTVAKLRTLIVLHLVTTRRAIQRAAWITRLSGLPMIASDREAYFRVTLPADDARALCAAIESNPGPLASSGKLIVWRIDHPGVAGAETVHVLLTVKESA